MIQSDIELKVKMYDYLQKTPARVRAMLGAAATTGHADSPATIVLRKSKKVAFTPKPQPRKGRKSKVKVLKLLKTESVTL